MKERKVYAIWLWNFPEDNQKMIDYRWRGIPSQIMWIFFIVYGQDSGPLSTEVGRTGKSDSLIAKYPKVMNITWIYWQAGKKPFESKKIPPIYKWMPNIFIAPQFRGSRMIFTIFFLIYTIYKLSNV